MFRFEKITLTILTSLILGAALIYTTEAFVNPSQTPPSGQGAFTYTSGGNVGVRNSNPQVTLDVNGSIRSAGGTGNIQVWDLDTGAPNSGVLTNLFRIRSGPEEGSLRIQLNTDSAGFFNTVQELIVIKDNGNVGIGSFAPGSDPAYKLTIDGALQLLASTQPTGANGVMYYDSTSNKFRCYENGAWKDCDTSGSGGMTNPMTTLGDIIYGGSSPAGTPTRLGGAAGFLKSTGAAAPAWSAVNLATADVTGILTAGKGGTENAFFKVSGPATSVKTYTFPNADETIATLGQTQSFSGAKTFSTTVTFPGTGTWNSSGQIGVGSAVDPAYRVTAYGGTIGGIKADTTDATDYAGYFANSGVGGVGLLVGAGKVRVSGLVSCDTIDTNASGEFVCGADAGAGGAVGGSGTTNYISKWTSASAIGNSQIFDNGTGVGIGMSSPSQKLSVAGTFGILEGGVSPSFYTIFQGGDQAANLTYTLPTASSNGVLTNTAGVLSWQSAGSSLNDVTGTSPIVVTTPSAGVRNVALGPSTPCATSQILKWNGTAWACAADDTGGGSSVPAGTLTGQTLYWNGTVWTLNTNIFNDNANVRIGAGSLDTTYNLTIPSSASLGGIKSETSAAAKIAGYFSNTGVGGVALQVATGYLKLPLLSCNGASVLETDASGNIQCGADAGAAGTGYATIQEEAASLAQRNTLNFIGSAITAADDSVNGRTNFTLSMSPSSASVVGTGRQIISGNGLSGGGDLSADRTLAVGAGTGISVAADTVAINTGAALTWTVAQTFSGGASFPGSGVWNSSGNVGIGISPAYKLDVAGQIRSSSGGFVFPDGSIQTTALNDTIRVFNKSGTFIVPVGVTKITVDVWGGGGGGGAGAEGSCPGYGGGGGGFGRGTFTVTPGNSYAVTVGNGGTASVFGTGIAGGTGQTSSFGALISATGGGGGLCNSVVGIGGTSAATINFSGESGFQGSGGDAGGADGYGGGLGGKVGTGYEVEIPGGGGSGSDGSYANPKRGGRGKVIVYW